MKFLIGFVVAAVALSGVLALPARSPNDDAEVIDVPRRPHRPAASSDDDADGFRDFKGFIDTGAGSGYPFLQPVPHPFSLNLGFFDSFEDIFRRLRTRLWPLELPSAAGDSEEEDAFSFNPKKGNTTSTVKIVDGHKIEINDTVYGDESSIFKVRVVNIRPLESGEDAGDVAPNEDKAGKPVTSAPTNNHNNNNNNNENDNDDSDERREPLDEKKPDDNEIKANIDDPEIDVAIEMLPTTSDVANLNAEFVTDNSLGSGSAEAETNKADSANMEDFQETALAPELNDEDADASSISDSRLVHNEQLTVEDNNGTDDAVDYEEETADNFNESHDEAESLTKNPNSIQSTQEADAKEELLEKGFDGDDESDDDVDADAELTAEFVDKTAEDIVAVNAEFDAELISIKHANQDDDDDEDVDDVDSSSMKHSKYAVNKRREDVSSSSDDEPEKAAAVEMNEQFNAEWETLAEDLASANDNNKDNDLSNDIDVYDAVPVDLSNDLAVNDIAASQPDFPTNPDAEFVDFDGVITSGSDMPRFEKLSVADTLNASSYQPQAYTQNFK